MRQEGSLSDVRPFRGALTRTAAAAGVGVLAAWAALAFNAVGSIFVTGAPSELLHLLRVYATFHHGAEALRADVHAPAAIATSMFLYTATGALLGAPLYLVYRRWFGWHTAPWRALNAAWLGVVMWLVNYYAVLTWAQPLALRILRYEGERRPYITEHIPGWVAAVTHVTFVAVVLLLQEPTKLTPRE
ncbi:hypothetical protein HN371_20220 [Candidatus Poribacteria bacterium]|jgi:hypothetical protein|nr:hypothetical protein [Candidatus Poribacteria bacterium]MBT5533442.1 hypothetical protein [Candidatus Poribacteria bacterium]MBT7098958.1 hypothetical protein [Candidatus Poribacteria bacterium]MBT7804137.1 hypothetical protein [Candidatus Poribacteria bacterium]